MPAKIKTNPETPIYFINPTGSGLVPGGSPTVNFQPESTASGAGRRSAQYDLGLGPRTTLFEWRSRVTLTGNSASNIGATVEHYIIASDGSNVDGNLSPTEGPLASTDQRRNLMSLGATTVDTASGTAVLTASGLVQIYSRFIQVAWWNQSNDAISSVASGNYFILTPSPDEIEL